MKIAAALMALSTAAYVLYEPIGGRHGRTWAGYGLGSVCALLVLWLLWFGVRKRSYHAGGAPLQGWLSAHVWLGASLVLLVPLHSAFQFGWNIHTLAYAAIVIVVLSGMVGVIAYALLPGLVTQNRAGRRYDAFVQELAEIDGECRILARGLPDAIARAVAASTAELPLGGGIRHQLRAGRPWKPPALEVFEETRETLAGDDRASTDRLIQLFARKEAVVEKLRRDLRYRTLLNLWLVIHVPMSILAVAAVGAHVFVVFYYW
jgi:hypothetical protein